MLGTEKVLKCARQGVCWEQGGCDLHNSRYSHHLNSLFFISLEVNKTSFSCYHDTTKCKVLCTEDFPVSKKQQLSDCYKVLTYMLMSLHRRFHHLTRWTSDHHTHTCLVNIQTFQSYSPLCCYNSLYSSRKAFH